jgi:opacity protein-like surface antigen
MKRTTLALLLFVLGTSTALAAEDNSGGFYAGAGVGQFNVQIDDVSDAVNTAQGFDSDDTSWKVFAGWRFTPVLAVELDYIDLGAPNESVSGVRLEAQINGVAPYFVATLPLGIFEIFGKVGYYFYDVEFDANDQTVRDDSAEDFVYGAGVGLVLFDHLAARLEYEIIDVSDLDDSDALWLTGAWRF